MKKHDYVEVITENKEYTSSGIHKGMQGEVDFKYRASEDWHVDFPEFGRQLVGGINEKDLKIIPNKPDPAVNERISRSFGEGPQGKKQLMVMDPVQMIVEKERYTKEGVHKGMFGWICFDEFVSGGWLVNFPQCGEKPDIAMIGVQEEDMQLVKIMDAIVNERLKEYFDNKEK